jgi:Protein of unknown function (DUF2510)
MPSRLPPAGWYPDPGGSGRRRYFNGSAWTDQYRPRRPDTSAASSGDDARQRWREELLAMPRSRLVFLNLVVVVVVVTHLILIGWALAAYGDKSALWKSHQFSYKLAPPYIWWMPGYVFAGYWALLAVAVRLMRASGARLRRGRRASVGSLDWLAVALLLVGLVGSIVAVVVSVNYLAHLPRGQPSMPHPWHW